MGEWLNNPWTIGIGTAVIAEIITSLTVSGRKLVQRMWRSAVGARPAIPSETVKLLPQPNGVWWHMGTMEGKPAMQITARLYATNLTNRPIQLLNTQLNRPRKHGLGLCGTLSTTCTGVIRSYQAPRQNCLAISGCHRPPRRPGRTCSPQSLWWNNLGTNTSYENSWLPTGTSSSR